MADHPCDVAVIGAGILGLASAMTLLERQPRLRVAVLEKDAAVASQQTGHNSGVLHSGIYYAPGSLKARFCVEGRRALLRFCVEHGVPFRAIGKLIVATRPAQLPRLRALAERGRANGVPGLRELDAAGLAALEPGARGVAALHAPGTSIVDFTAVARAMLARFRALGGQLHLGAAVVAARRPHSGGVVLETGAGAFHARRVLNCAGLHADRVARLLGERPDLAIIPFRGEYYTLSRPAAALVRHLLYPVPDPALPFLGVHLTPTMRGTVEAGPNAILATHREGYRKRDLSLRDAGEVLAFPGFWRLAARHARTAVAEVRRSFSTAVFLRDLQEMFPALRREDLAGRGAGVRAQAVDRDGRLLDDFRILRSPDALHVLNAPSPGATSSLVIARHLVEQLGEVWIPHRPVVAAGAARGAAAARGGSPRRTPAPLAPPVAAGGGAGDRS